MPKRLTIRPGTAHFLAWLLPAVLSIGSGQPAAAQLASPPAGVEMIAISPELARRLVNVPPLPEGYELTAHQGRGDHRAPRSLFTRLVITKGDPVPDIYYPAMAIVVGTSGDLSREADRSEFAEGYLRAVPKAFTNLGWNLVSQTPATLPRFPSDERTIVSTTFELDGGTLVFEHTLIPVSPRYYTISIATQTDDDLARFRRLAEQVTPVAAIAN